MTATEAREKLEGWRDLLKAKLEGVTPGKWYWEYGMTMRTAWGLIAEREGKGDRYILRFEGPNDIENCPKPEADMILIEMAQPFARAMLAGIEAALNQHMEPVPLDCDDSGSGYEERQIEGYKSRLDCWQDSEDLMIVSVAKAYEPFFQEVQS